MGVTIHSQNKSIDLSYFGFDRLRHTVAYAADETFGALFEKSREIANADCRTDQGLEAEMLHDHFHVVNHYLEIHPELEAVAKFIYEPDAEGQLTYEECKALWNFVKDYDDNMIYGYAGWESPAMFRDFKNLLEDCVKNRTSLEWL